jgi:tetratricopeptide (TPR) repeat protein
MKYFLAILFAVAILLNAEAQTTHAQSDELLNEAIALMDQGKIDESLKLLQQARDLDPEYINISYEMAFAYQMKEDYDKCIEIARPLIKHPDAFDQVYQMIGNAYDLKGDKAKAIKYYDKGLKKFPNSGRLYLEKGLVTASQGDWGRALNIWEQGIDADPTHSSNYYYASQVLAQTEEKIWAVYYGEVFMNLEPNTGRTAEISKLLFDTYTVCLPIKDDKWGLAFSRKATNITIGSLKDLKFSFETVHNLAMEQGYKDVPPIFGMENFIKIRKQFLEKWNEDYASRYPNLIFDYHNYLIKSNMFEAYIYWLLKDGAEDEFENWRSANQEVYSNFVAWVNENKMLFTKENKTNRSSYD